jgi:DnaK suppressor protein
MSMTFDRAHIESLLAERKADLDAELERLTATPRDPMTAVSFGKRIGDGTTEAVDRLNNVAAAEALAAKASEVDRALEKLDEGTYGRCDNCGEEIPEERLEAIPWACSCVPCLSGSGSR